MIFYTMTGTLKDSHYVYLFGKNLTDFYYTWRMKNLKTFGFDPRKVVHNVIFGHHFVNQIILMYYNPNPNVHSSGIKLHLIFHIIWKTMLPYVRFWRYHHPCTRIKRVVNFQGITFHLPICSFADICEDASTQKQVSEQQHSELLKLLKQQKQLFNIMFGCYQTFRFNIDLEKDMVPYHCERPYPITQVVR